NIDWRAKGGIFTKPTIFGMNGGNLQGAGEAGREAVLPLNRKTLGQIGEGIAATMVGTTGSMNQLMNDMSRMMAISMSQLSGLKSVMSGVYGNMSNSRQAMNGNAAGAMSVPIINAGGPVPTSPQDMIVQVVVDQPIIVDGRTVQRVVKKENYREDNINFLKRGQ
ncbi:DUF2207 domain-containing protein, partial [Bacillus wiedmannii]